MASSRIRRVINLGNGWKYTVYLKPIEYAMLNLFIVIPFHLMVLMITGLIWLYIKLPYMIIKYLYKQTKLGMNKLSEYIKNKKTK
jgi:hypothetical protein